MHEAEQEIQALIRGGESLTIEFKSDARSLSDRELVAAVVALANTEGGDLFLGVEDDGTPT
ncbi:MAG: ATP-binding protein, partial [Pseudohongiellaceae bacterium]